MPKMFGKVFIAFWASSLLVVTAVATLGFALGNRPLLYLWLAHSLDLYAQAAVNLYEHGGADNLERYLDDMQKSSAIDSTLIDANGMVLSTHAIPVAAEGVLAAAQKSGNSQYRVQDWTAAITVSGAHGNYVLVARIHPWRRKQIALQPSLLLTRGLLALFVAAVLCLIMARYLTRPIRELQAVTKRISAGDLTARATPILGNRGDELAELAVDFDRMTERVQMLLERQQTLMRDISHELRSPLARLSLSAELVRRGDIEASHRMDADIRRLESLISELLTLSRIEAFEHSTRRDIVNVSSMVRQIIQDAEFEGAPDNKQIVQTGRSDIVLLGDANLLQRSIENVVRNAIRYTRVQTTIEVNVAQIKLASSASYAVVRVIDEGPGVPTEALPHLFEPFFRASESRSQRGGGSGLGLSISQRVAALHGGYIKALNRREGGLEVAIYLPLTSNAASSGLLNESANQLVLG